MNWKDPETYQYTGQLSREEWAWEFLRRNPEYRQQWQAFMQVWRALETDYGKAPNRDFCAWKLDPRAWVRADQCEESDCRVDQDKVLIECALGARWGFYKFPPDPDDQNAVSENRLSWRDPDPASEQVALTAEDKAYLGEQPEKVAMGFDLDLPLKEQLEKAKRFLQLAQRRGVRQGDFEILSLKLLRPRLQSCLRIIDALNQGVREEELIRESDAGFSEALIQEAKYYLASGYRDLLSVSQK